MQLIQGDTLQSRWDKLSHADKTSICEQLHSIVTALRQIKQAPGETFIGKYLTITSSRLTEILKLRVPRSAVSARSRFPRLSASQSFQLQQAVQRLVFFLSLVTF